MDNTNGSYETIESSGAIIRCGCGFFASSNDQDLNYEAFEDHNCPNKKGESWIVGVFETIFSAYGLGITGFMVAIILSVFLSK